MLLIQHLRLPLSIDMKLCIEYILSVTDIGSFADLNCHSCQNGIDERKLCLIAAFSIGNIKQCTLFDFRLQTGLLLQSKTAHMAFFKARTILLTQITILTQSSTPWNWVLLYIRNLIPIHGVYTLNCRAGHHETKINCSVSNPFLLWSLIETVSV